MKPFVLTALAEQDVREIWEYIARRPSRQEAPILPGLLQIIRILHAARDMKSILGLSPDEQ